MSGYVKSKLPKVK